MKKRIKSILTVLLTAMFLTMLMAQTAFAAEGPGITIPVKVTLSGTLPSKAEEFLVKLSADNLSYPMPEGAEKGIYSMIVTGQDSKDFPTIYYSRVGIYTYTIYQEPGTNSKCTYDKSIYNLKVYVTNREDGKGLEATAVLYPYEGGDKLPAAVFNNVYETEPAPVTPDNPNPPTVTPTPPSLPSTAVLGDSAAPVTDIPSPEVGVLGEAKGPGTGDTAPVILWGTMFVTAAVVLGVYSINSRKRYRGKKK